jgi:ABC-type antimicrobial peptide transport system permease subunit
MVIKNLLRRKGRTILTILGISIGVSAIVILGVMADGIGEGYQSVISGSKADLTLSQKNTLEISMSGIDESIGDQLLGMSEISEVSGMTQGIVTADDLPYFYLWGYPIDSFVLERFHLIVGDDLGSHAAQLVHGKPIIIGSGAAEALGKGVGDSVRLTSTSFRIIGIYETGSAFEDGGGVVSLGDAQELLGRARQVNMFYIKLKEPQYQERVIKRAERLWPDYQMVTSRELSDQQLMGDTMNVYVAVLGGIAIVIGGVGMTNSQLMAVFERTREIGVLRAVGWSSKRVLIMIVEETLIVSLLGGVFGILLGLLGIKSLEIYLVAFGGTVTNVSIGLIAKAMLIVLILGLVGGLYPAWRASRLRPIEALRYEGGSGSGKNKHFPVGGMTVQSLWQRTTRTLLTLGMIAITIGSIISLQAITEAMKAMFDNMAMANGAEIMMRQADLSDTSQSVIDQKDLSKIASMPEIEAVSGFVFTSVSMPKTLFFIVMGYEPNNFGIKRYKIVEGQPLRTNREIILGQTAATTLQKKPGDMIELGNSRYKVVGIFQTGVGWENMGGVITLRDAQAMSGRPRKVTLASVKVVDPNSAEQVVEKINHYFPDIHATLSGEFAENMPDMKAMDAMIGGISFFAIVIGGVGIMNTMLMAVLERTREIGTLRAVGWRRRTVLSNILKEALLLGSIGGLLAIPLALMLTLLIKMSPTGGTMFDSLGISFFNIITAIFTSLILGALGGFYPALRATRMQPVEALRYE